MYYTQKPEHLPQGTINLIEIVTHSRTKSSDVLN